MPEEAAGVRRDEHEVTPVELFFDLVFVFAITQVTRLFVQESTWLGLLRGMLVLAAIWWAWNSFAWLTSAENIDEGGDPRHDGTDARRCTRSSRSLCARR